MASLKERYQARFGIKQPLRGYQLRAAKVGVNCPNYGLLMAPRLGKTRIDIAVTGYRWLQGQVSKWVIICPSVAKSVWAEELLNTLNVPFELETIEGAAEERKAMLKGWKNTAGVLSILIINPEATWRLKKLLYKSNPDKVTLDESHRIKNHAAKQSKTIQVLGKRASYRTILTGTFMSTPTDCFSQFKFLDPTIFGERWKRSKFGGPDGFLDRYVATYGFGGHKPKTFKNLDEMATKISSVTYQLTRADAGGFPQEQYQTVRFSLTGTARRHYDNMWKNLKTVVLSSKGNQKVVAPIVLTQVLRLQQITGGFLPVPDPDENQVENVPLGSDRIKALRGIVEEYPTDYPLVIFCKFRYEVQAITALMEQLKRSSATIVGGMKPADRDINKQNFQKGRVDTIVAQVRAGGISIDLSRSDTGIFYSSTSSYIDYEQAKARIIARTGGSVSLLSLAAEGTVDEDIIRSVQENRDISELIFNQLWEKDK